MKSNGLALILGASLGAMGCTLTRVDEEMERFKLQSPEEFERLRQMQANERRWADMTQADIDRLTEAHEKRERRKGRVK